MDAYSKAVIAERLREVKTDLADTRRQLKMYKKRLKVQRKLKRVLQTGNVEKIKKHDGPGKAVDPIN